MLGIMAILAEVVPMVFEDDLLVSGALRVLLLILEVLLRTYLDSIEPPEENNAPALPAAEEHTPTSANPQAPEQGDPTATTDPTVTGTDKPETTDRRTDDPLAE